MEKHYVADQHLLQSPPTMSGDWSQVYLASEVDAAAAEGTLTANAQRDAVIDAMEKSLRNCLLLAMRKAHSDPSSDWRHIIRFCTEAGCGPSPLRTDS